MTNHKIYIILTGSLGRIYIPVNWGTDSRVSGEEVQQVQQPSYRMAEYDHVKHRWFFQAPVWKRKLPNQRETLTMMDAHHPGWVHNLCQYSRIRRDILIAMGPRKNQVISSLSWRWTAFLLAAPRRNSGVTCTDVCHVISSFSADQFIQILTGVTMQTRIRQFYHIGSDRAFRSQAACSSRMPRHSGPEAPKLKITHALLQGDIPDPGTKPASLTSPAFAGGFFTTSTTWAVHKNNPPSPLNHRLNASDIFTFENNIGV